MRVGSNGRGMLDWWRSLHLARTFKLGGAAGACLIVPVHAHRYTCAEHSGVSIWISAMLLRDRGKGD